MRHPGYDTISRRRFTMLAAMIAAIPSTAWGQDASPQMPGGDEYAHPGMLVEAASLAAGLDSGDPGVLVAFMAGSDAAGGVIPGSVRIDWPDLETADTSDAGLTAWLASIDDHLTALGITPSTPVTVYDPGTLFATRLWWVLHAVGHREIRVLNGGLAAWSSDGRPIDPAVAAPTPTVESYGAFLDLTAIAPIAEVEAAVGSEGVTFIDARSPQEWEAGHIPGAINLPYERNVVPESPRTWLAAERLDVLYAEVPRENLVIPYCSSGVRSAVTAFTLRLIGYPDVRLFTGSWNEWITDPSRPVTVGTIP